MNHPREDHSGWTGGAAARVAVRVRGLTKSFPGVRALRSVDLDIHEGEVHGLVGQNGAGKSTLIKHLSGVYAIDDGTIELFGKRLLGADPRARTRAGVGVIYQERSIIPELSAAANVFLGNAKTWGPFISQRATHKRFSELAARLGAQVEPEARAGSLSVATQQLLEIMRALDSEHRLLIMDEPTTALGAREREKLYRVIDGLKHKQLSILFISHDLEAVLRICDRVSVMRDGQLVATRRAQDWTKEQLVGAMLGSAQLTKCLDRAAVRGDVALRVEAMKVPGIVNGIALEVRGGEILGIAGLVGSGRTEILRALAGADPASSGRMFIDGIERRWPRSVPEALHCGIALAPEDRKRQGLVLEMSCEENLTLSKLDAIASWTVIDRARQTAKAGAAVQELAFDAGRLPNPSHTLSGGNQQKLVVGKWLHRRPKVLLLDEPTQGIDVGAKAELFNVISRLANEGTSIVFVSSEFEEVIHVADRTVVLGRGSVLATLDRAEVSSKRILGLLFDLAH